MWWCILAGLRVLSAVSAWAAACWRQMVDRPKRSTQSLSMLRQCYIPRIGLIRATRPGKDASLELSAHIAAWSQRNSVLLLHMA